MQPAEGVDLCEILRRAIAKTTHVLGTPEARPGWTLICIQTAREGVASMTETLYALETLVTGAKDNSLSTVCSSPLALQALGECGISTIMQLRASSKERIVSAFNGKAPPQPHLLILAEA